MVNVSSILTLQLTIKIKTMNTRKFTHYIIAKLIIFHNELKATARVIHSIKR